MRDLEDIKSDVTERDNTIVTPGMKFIGQLYPFHSPGVMRGLIEVIIRLEKAHTRDGLENLEQAEKYLTETIAQYKKETERINIGDQFIGHFGKLCTVDEISYPWVRVREESGWGDLYKTSYALHKIDERKKNSSDSANSEYIDPFDFPYRKVSEK